MSVIDGKECLKVIKNRGATKEIPVMMYSTSSNAKDIEEFYFNGADYYVIKPDNNLALTKLGEEICMGEINASVRGNCTRF
jgi:CheY-like chemotaxis protein